MTLPSPPPSFLPPFFPFFSFRPYLASESNRISKLALSFSGAEQVGALVVYFNAHQCICIAGGGKVAKTKAKDKGKGKLEISNRPPTNCLLPTPQWWR